MGRQNTYKENRNAERKDLQGVSNNRVKNWPNTIEAMRLKREEDRIRRLEDDEVSNIQFNQKYYSNILNKGILSQQNYVTFFYSLSVGPQMPRKNSTKLN